MRIFLYRHGESEANKDKFIHTVKADHAITLSPLGEYQARAAGKFAKEYVRVRRTHSPTQPTYIAPGAHIRMWVSPYARTRRTAELILEEAGPETITDVRENIHLVEQQFGMFDGLSHEPYDNELKRKFPHEYAFYKKQEDFEGKFWARMPLGESRFDVALRVHQCFGTFHRDAIKHGIENLFIVAHGLSIRAFVMQWLHLSVEWFEREPNPRNCSIRLIEDGQDKGYIYAGGDTEEKDTVI